MFEAAAIGFQPQHWALLHFAAAAQMIFFKIWVSTDVAIQEPKAAQTSASHLGHPVLECSQKVGKPLKLMGNVF